MLLRPDATLPVLTTPTSGVAGWTSIAVRVAGNWVTAA